MARPAPLQKPPTSNSTSAVSRDLGHAQGHAQDRTGGRSGGHDPAPEADRKADTLRADMAALAAKVELFAPAIERPDRIPPLFRPPGFPALVQLILEQQVSVRAAQAMWGRLTQCLSPITPEGLLTLSETTLKRCGFSAQKIGYAQRLAQSIESGDLDLDTLSTLADDDAIVRLTAHKGIGPWTAECYLLWALGRRDIMPAGDLAIQVGFQELAGLPNRPDAAAMRAAAEDWRPYRSAAAMLLWRVYLDNRAADGSTLTAAATTTPPPTAFKTLSQNGTPR